MIGTSAPASRHKGFSFILLAGLFTWSWHSSIEANAFAVGFQQGSARGSSSRVYRLADEDEDLRNAEDIEVWDQTPHELSLDVRELLVTDANLFFFGPDVDEYEAEIRAVLESLNYTLTDFPYASLEEAVSCMGTLENGFIIPPVQSVMRWPYKISQCGLQVWIDNDSHQKQDEKQIDKIRRKKFPQKKPSFGPTEGRGKTPAERLTKKSIVPPADPLDMWQNADVHVDLQYHREAHPDLPIESVIKGSIIDAMLRSPAKWREWTKAAKWRGTIPSDYQNDWEVKRKIFGFGCSPRLNKLLNA